MILKANDLIEIEKSLSAISELLKFNLPSNKLTEVENELDHLTKLLKTSHFKSMLKEKGFRVIK